MFHSSSHLGLGKRIGRSFTLANVSLNSQMRNAISSQLGPPWPQRKNELFHLIPTRCGRAERVQGVESEDLEGILPFHGYGWSLYFLTLNIWTIIRNLWAFNYRDGKSTRQTENSRHLGYCHWVSWLQRKISPNIIICGICFQKLRLRGFFCPLSVFQPFKRAKLTLQDSLPCD